MRHPVRVVIDVLVIVLFAIVGRASHAEVLDAGGILRTAAPFVAGALLAWIGIMLRRRQDSALVQGVMMWLSTLVFGMLFRLLIGDGVQAAFVVVAGLALAVGLIGWRMVEALIRRRSVTAKPGAKKHDPARSGNPAVREQARKARGR